MLFERLIFVHDVEPHEGALNMAIDEVLLHECSAPILRVYSWKEPTVTFGYFGKIAEVVQTYGESPLTRRWTGGGTVVHGKDFTYSVIVPRSCSFFAHNPLESYRLIHEEVSRSLQRAGFATRLAQTPDLKAGNECFLSPAPHDILAGVGKIAGAAQRRTRNGMLHQGSIQIPDLPADFVHQLLQSLCPHTMQRPLAEEELKKALLLSRDKYSTPAWLHRF